MVLHGSELMFFKIKIQKNASIFTYGIIFFLIKSVYSSNLNQRFRIPKACGDAYEQAKHVLLC